MAKRRPMDLVERMIKTLYDSGESGYNIARAFDLEDEIVLDIVTKHQAEIDKKKNGEL